MISTQLSGSVMELTIERPHRRNALDFAAVRDLEAAISEVADTDARVLLLRGAEGTFCAGADLQEVGDVLNSDWKDNDEMLASFSRTVVRLRRLPVAIICALEGHAVGAGAALALACDLLVTSPSAKLRMGSFQLGMTPDGGLSFLLTRAIGAREVVKMALLGSDLDGATMDALGIATELVADDAVLDRARTLAQEVARSIPPAAVVGLRELVDSATGHGFAAQYELEASWVRNLRCTEDFREGITAFLERRTARFQGT